MADHNNTANTEQIIQLSATAIPSTLHQQDLTQPVDITCLVAGTHRGILLGDKELNQVVDNFNAYSKKRKAIPSVAQCR